MNINNLTSSILTIVLAMGIAGCGEERVKNSNNLEEKANMTASSKSDKQADNIRTNTVDANKSKTLRQISEEQGEIKKTDCEEKFKNKNGDCEIPNQPYPNRKKIKKNK